MLPSKEKLIEKIKSACAEGLVTSTLGKRSQVIFGEDKKGLYVVAGQTKYRISNEIVEVVVEKFIAPKKEGGMNRHGHQRHLSAGEYNEPNWQGCPNNRACPYIAAALQET